MHKVFPNWHICVYFRMNTRAHTQFKRTTHSPALQLRIQSIYIYMAQINARMPLIITHPPPTHCCLELQLQLQLKYEICIWFVCVCVYLQLATPIGPNASIESNVHGNNWPQVWKCLNYWTSELSKATHHYWAHWPDWLPTPPLLSPASHSPSSLSLCNVAGTDTPAR